jgi:iron complex transport system ATP-binding protein
MPTHGTIELLGQTYGQSDWRELRKSVGLVSSAVSQMIPDSEPALDTVLSGPRAMIGLWVRGRTPDRRAARRALQQVGCGRLFERPWAVLSQGERQRVLIARALMARPALLILDEPCAGLDPLAREHFLEFLDRLGHQTACPTLILVTHHVEEIMPVFNRVLVLKGGHVLKSGPRSSVLTSRWMSEALGGEVRVGKQPTGRCSLGVSTASKRVV